MLPYPRTSSQSPRAGVIGRIVPSVGNWQLVQLIGEGRWASVYRARPRALPPNSPSDYAVKLARSDDNTRPLAAEILRREALVGSTVFHAHLCCVLSSHVHRPPFYLVMPYLEGVTAEQAMVQTGSIPVSRAIWVARQIAEAMTALHSAGWIHSDVKPSNILVSSDNHATLLDLGLARRIGCDECHREGPLAGTLSYAAPESFSSLVDTGPASDVYALGVTLYEMMVGALPFVEDRPERLAAAHVHCHPPDPRNHNPHVSAEVVQLLECMLDKQPSRRPTFDDLVQWLTDLEHDSYGQRIAA
jgi:serine/threonine protein kinase